MAKDEPRLSGLVDQLDALAWRDRRAVLARLAPADRNRIAAVRRERVAAQRAEVARTRRAGRQFAGYSTWLAERVESACGDKGSATAALTPTTRSALANVHAAIQRETEAEDPGFGARLARWMERLIGPAPKARPEVRK